MINEYLKKHKEIIEIKGVDSFRNRTPLLVCNDGFKMSVQVGYGLYCTPRISDCDHYTHAEVGFPSIEEPLMMEYADDPENPTNTIYPYMPIEIINEVIQKHGGVQ